MERKSELQKRENQRWLSEVKRNNESARALRKHKVGATLRANKAEGNNKGLGLDKEGGVQAATPRPSPRPVPQSPSNLPPLYTTSLLQDYLDSEGTVTKGDYSFFLTNTEPESKAPEPKDETLSADNMVKSALGMLGFGSPEPTTETMSTPQQRATRFSRAERATRTNRFSPPPPTTGGSRLTLVRRATPPESESESESSESEPTTPNRRGSAFAKRITYLNASASRKKEIDHEFAFGGGTEVKRKASQKMDVYDEVEVGSSKLESTAPHQQKLTEGQHTILKLHAYKDAKEVFNSPRAPFAPPASKSSKVFGGGNTAASRANRFSQKFIKRRNDRPTFHEMKKKGKDLESIRRHDLSNKSKPSPAFFRRKSSVQNPSSSSDLAVMLTQIRSHDETKERKDSLFMMPLNNRGRTTEIYKSLPPPALASPAAPASISLAARTLN